MSLPVGLAHVPVLPAGCALTVGVFDGVHRGHQALVARTVRAAHRRGVPSVAVTFDPHPHRTLRPGAEPALLTTLDHRVTLLEAHGIDRVVVLRFDDELAGLSASAFVEGLVVAGLHARHVAVGAGFRFGRGGLGDVALLTGLGLRWGFEVDEVAAVNGSGVSSTSAESPDEVECGGRVSSTLVRRLVSLGRVEEAAALLGRPHRLTGHVRRVLAASRAGEPDIVLVEPVPGMVEPAPGRYVGSLRAPGIGAVELVRRSAGSGVREYSLRGLGPSHVEPGQRVEVDVHRVLSRQIGQIEPTEQTDVGRSPASRASRSGGHRASRGRDAATGGARGRAARCPS